MSSAARRSRPGRPRHIPEIDSKVSPREQILDVCARLFTQRGYAATSTRDIADGVGIRQASIYHYFAGKPGILAELLERAARPDLDTVARIEDICPSGAPEVALYLLVLTDGHVLAAAPHNACLLHRFPDVRSAPAYEPFLGMLHDLGQAYGRLGVAVLGHAVADSMGFDQVRNMLVTVVEGILTTRSEGESITRAYLYVIAEACLRACGVADERIEYVTATAMRMVAEGDLIMRSAQDDLVLST
jgi:AcrR family transcriptional regulator